MTNRFSYLKFILCCFCCISYSFKKKQILEVRKTRNYNLMLVELRFVFRNFFVVVVVLFKDFSKDDIN